jgi:VanZ family protein
LSVSEPWRNPRPSPELAGLGSRLPPRSLFPEWLRAWWPALLWAAVIFLLSTDRFSCEHTASVFQPLLRWLLPTLTTGQSDQIHHVIRKSAHFAEYFIFFLLLYRGLQGARRGWHSSWAVLAWFIAAAYSSLDEIHQSFVASRGASAWDALLDSTDALVALTVVFLFGRFQPTNK